jgi:hypothetical protein
VVARLDSSQGAPASSFRLGVWRVTSCLDENFGVSSERLPSLKFSVLPAPARLPLPLCCPTRLPFPCRGYIHIPTMSPDPSQSIARLSTPPGRNLPNRNHAFPPVRLHLRAGNDLCIPCLSSPPSSPTYLTAAHQDAWNIGANDVANSFATSVSSRSLTLPQAMVVATFMEFLGALLVGARVSDTIKSKISSCPVYRRPPARIR